MAGQVGDARRQRVGPAFDGDQGRAGAAKQHDSVDGADERVFGFRRGAEFRKGIAIVFEHEPAGGFFEVGEF
jgi:hypothetical protein